MTETDGRMTLKQHRRTANHDWNSFFDSHLYNGRVVHFIVKKRPDQAVAEMTIGIDLLKKHCGDESTSETRDVPVCICVFNSKLLCFYM